MTEGRDLGVTRWVVEHRPEWPAVYEVMALPGELLVIVGVVGLLVVLDVLRQVRDGGPEAPLCSDRVWSILAIVLGGLALIVALESIIGAGRPPAAWHLVEPSPRGFPSGHTMAATITWGALAWWYGTGVSKRRMIALGIVLAAVASSRVLLGVHYLVDVIAALAIGGAYLVVADRYVLDRPRHAFILAILIGIVAFIASWAGSRGTLAIYGALGGGIAWLVLEKPRVRVRVREVVGQDSE